MFKVTLASTRIRSDAAASSARQDDASDPTAATVMLIISLQMPAEVAAQLLALQLLLLIPESLGCFVQVSRDCCHESRVDTQRSLVAGTRASGCGSSDSRVGITFLLSSLAATLLLDNCSAVISTADLSRLGYSCLLSPLSLLRRRGDRWRRVLAPAPATLLA